MVNDEIMQKVLNIMTGSDLIFLRGQLRNIQRSEKDGMVYYLADMKVPRQLKTKDVYEVSFNLVHVCFSSDFVKQNHVSDELMLTYKNNEVLLNVSLNSKIRRVKKEDMEYKNNDVKFFVDDIILLNEIEKPKFTAGKVIKL